MATAVEVMKNFFTVLKDFSAENTNYIGEIALDKAVRAVTILDDFKYSVNVFKTLLTADNIDGYSNLDSDARLQKVTGMIIGADNDYDADTGAISGSNAGGSVKKNAADIVPESGDLSTATLPAEGSTTQITYTGDDGKSFTFNVKWPDSFTKFVSGTAVDSTTDPNVRLKDSQFLVDLNDFDENEKFYSDNPFMAAVVDMTYDDMKKGELTILKGLNTYWLQAGAKLIYDSYGLDFDGKTIEIQLIAGGDYMDSQFTTARNTDSLPSDNLIIGLNLLSYGKIDETNPNGISMFGSLIRKFLDRTIAHEMVHAAMLASGTLKYSGMPTFFIEGVADLVQGDDDFNSSRTEQIRNFFTSSDALTNALSYEESSGAAYPAGDMYLRFLAKTAESTNIFVGTDENKNQTINFDGNATIITNYDESNVINYDTAFQAATISETFNDFVVIPSYNFGEGLNSRILLIRDVRGKLMSFTSQSGDVYAYMADDSGEIDGRTFGDGNKVEILFGMNNKNNVLRAGNGGSYLWGGYLGNDELYGGAGEDGFIYDINGGNDTVYNAESQDTVFLRNVDLSQITSAQINDNGVNISFTYGGSLNVFGQPANFVIENDGAVYSVDYQNKTWTQKN